MDVERYTAAGGPGRAEKRTGLRSRRQFNKWALCEYLLRCSGLVLRTVGLQRSHRPVPALPAQTVRLPTLASWRR